MFRYLLKRYREYGGNSRTVVLVGSNKNMAELYQEMAGDPTTGFRISGYFCDLPSNDFPESIPYLGQPKEVVTYLQQHHIEQVDVYKRQVYKRTGKVYNNPHPGSGVV